VNVLSILCNLEPGSSGISYHELTSNSTTGAELETRSLEKITVSRSLQTRNYRSVLVAIETLADEETSRGHFLGRCCPIFFRNYLRTERHSTISNAVFTLLCCSKCPHLDPQGREFRTSYPPTCIGDHNNKYARSLPTLWSRLQPIKSENLEQCN
jgi:hypothetical protein